MSENVEEQQDQEQPERQTIVKQLAALQAQIDNLRVEIGQQNRHIDVLWRALYQHIDRMNEEVGGDWKPDLHADLPGPAWRPAPDVTDALVTADNSRRARRTDKFLEGQSS